MNKALFLSSIALSLATLSGVSFLMLLVPKNHAWGYDALFWILMIILWISIPTSLFAANRPQVGKDKREAAKGQSEGSGGEREGT